MKKYLAVLSIAGLLVSCGNEGSSAGTVQDSVLEKIDSTGEAKVDSIQEATDSLKNVVENTFEKTDSANRANPTMPDSTRK